MPMTEQVLGPETEEALFTLLCNQGPWKFKTSGHFEITFRSDGTGEVCRNVPPTSRAAYIVKLIGFAYLIFLDVMRILLEEATAGT